MREGLTVAIRKKVKVRKAGATDDTESEVTLPSFCYPPTDGLAQVIVDLWANPGHILDRKNNGLPTPQAVMDATAKINAAVPGFDLTKAVIITEQEHDNHYTMQDPREVVFVLPDKQRVTTQTNLETAKLLMACTPNGI
jgi:hypothetical protein